MNLKRIFAVILIAILALSFASCSEEKNECSSHVDADDDLLCDSCGAQFDDGEEPPVAETYYISVEIMGGGYLNNASFTLSLGGFTETYTTDKDGRVSAELVAGTYKVSFDYDTLPEGFLPETSSITLGDFKSVSVYVVDNNPDGTKEKPFVISTSETEFSIADGSEVYYIYHGAPNRRLEIKSDKLAVNYNGEIYSANEDGVISIQLSADVGSAIYFSVKNLSSDQVSGNIELISPPGSLENPYEITENETTASVPEEGMIHYSFTADKTGVLVITSETQNSSIAITKTLAHDVPVSAEMIGGGAAYMAVSEGETVTITVSSTKKDALDVVFFSEVYSSDAAVPVLKNEFGFGLEGNGSSTFVSESGKTLTITDADSIKVYVNGTLYTPANGTITVALGDGGEFRVENDSDAYDSFIIEVK